MIKKKKGILFCDIGLWHKYSCFTKINDKKVVILRKKYVVPQLLSEIYGFIHQYIYVKELDYTMQKQDVLNYSHNCF